MSVRLSKWNGWLRKRDARAWEWLRKRDGGTLPEKSAQSSPMDLDGRFVASDNAAGIAMNEATPTPLEKKHDTRDTPRPERGAARQAV
jgi:hypothetical protein